MVQAGTLFEYVAAFITIVLGLALADLLISLHRLLRVRRRVVWRPLPLLLGLFVFLTLLSVFFNIWQITRWNTLYFPLLVWQICLQIPIFLAACAVFPDEITSERIDLDDFYFSERRYIGFLLIFGLIIDFIDQTARNWSSVLDNSNLFLSYFVPLNILALGALTSIAWSKREWVHWIAFAVLFGVAYQGFFNWHITGAPAWVPAPS